MPDVTLKQTKINNYYISLRTVTSYDITHYEVSLAECYGCEIYRVSLSCSYGLDQKKKALATYSRYCRKARGNN